MRFILFLTVLFLTLGTPLFPAQANTSETEKSQLRALVVQTLADYKTAYEQTGGTFDISGDVNIEQAESYYAVTLPRLLITDKTGQRGEIDMIALNVSRASIPESWKMSVALPTSLSYFDAGGKPTTRIDLGTQKISGIWHEKLRQFTSLNAVFDNLIIHEFETSTRTILPTLTVLSDLKPSGDALWSGQASAHAVNIQTLDQNGQQLSLTAEMKGIADIKNLSADIETALGTNTKTDHPLRSLGFKADDIQAKMTLHHARFFAPFAGAKSVTEYALQNLALTLNLKDMNKSHPSAGVLLDWTGLTATPNRDDFNSFVPGTFYVDMDLEKIPSDTLFEFIQKTVMAQSAQTPSARQIVALQAMLLLPQIFSKAGTSLTIKDSYAISDTYQTLLKGNIKASDTSVIGASGQLNGEISGLRDLEKKIKARLESSSENDRHIWQNALDRVSWLKTLGREGTGSRGKPAYLYDFVMGEKGDITFNGRTLTELMMDQSNLKDAATKDPATKDTTAPR
ncbi:MAG: hypothetical protein J0L77_09860 [Alphaproteobacteria bacterium]|nr:hypothetical protein [Alphaproteobacteria bacterium]